MISKTEFLTRVMKLEELLQRLEEAIDETIVEEVLWYDDAVVEREEMLDTKEMNNLSNNEIIVE